MLASFVTPVLTFGANLWAVTGSLFEKVEAQNRKFLRRLVGIWYPHIIKNSHLYKLVGQKPLLPRVLLQRWLAFGHQLRQPRTSPFWVAVRVVLERFKSVKVCMGRPRANIVSLLSQELNKLPSSYLLSRFGKRVINFWVMNDMEKVAKVATDRQAWRLLVTELTKVNT